MTESINKTPESVRKAVERYRAKMTPEERYAKKLKYSANTYIKKHATIEDLEKIKTLVADRLNELSKR